MKVAVVGAGMVGSSAAYALAIQGIANEIVLVDRNDALATAQAQDISHAVPFSSATQVSSGGYADITGSDVVIISAGVNQQPGETRLELLGRNAIVFRDVVGEIMRYASDAILLVASNPVDVMTYVTQKISGLPPERVIGSGTILDTARFRSLVGRYLEVSPQSVHSYVLGEHGDSEVLAWSSARVGAVPVREFGEQVGRPMTIDVIKQIDLEVRTAAERIIRGKGATYFGIGAGLAAICKAIARDQRAVLSVSAVTRNFAGVKDMAASVPRIIGRQGVAAELFPPLEAQEQEDLFKSASLLKACVASLHI